MRRKQYIVRVIQKINMVSRAYSLWISAENPSKAEAIVKEKGLTPLYVRKAA